MEIKIIQESFCNIVLILNQMPFVPDEMKSGISYCAGKK